MELVQSESPALKLMWPLELMNLLRAAVRQPPRRAAAAPMAGTGGARREGARAATLAAERTRGEAIVCSVGEARATHSRL